MNLAIRRTVTTAFFDLVDRMVHRRRLRRVYHRVFDTPASRSGLTVLDVGAHEGESIRFFRDLLDEPEVYAFEPQSEVCRATGERFAQTPAVHVLNRALGEQSGRREISLNVDTRSSGFTALNPQSNWLRKKSLVLGTDPEHIVIGSEEVDVDTLDGVLEEFGLERVDVLKLDVEGHERQVLRGGVETFARGAVRVLQIEIHHDDMYVDYDAAEIVAHVESLGFRIIARLRFPFLMWEEVIFLHESAVAG